MVGTTLTLVAAPTMSVLLTIQYMTSTRVDGRVLEQCMVQSTKQILSQAYEEATFTTTMHRALCVTSNHVAPK